MHFILNYRIQWSHRNVQVHQLEQENRTFIKNLLLLCGEIDNARCPNAQLCIDYRQLFRLQFGKWFVFFTHANCVCFNHYFFECSLMISIIALFICRLPFNWKTPHGYLIALFLESIASFTVGSIIVPPICIVIGSCFLVSSFVNDMAVKMPKLDVKKRPNGKSQEIKKHFCNIIGNISDAKQLSFFYIVHITWYKETRWIREWNAINSPHEE